MRKVTAEEVQAAMRAANIYIGSLTTQFGVTFSLNSESLHDCGIAADWINAASGPDHLSCPGPNRQARAAQFGLTLDAEASRHPSQVSALATVEALRRAIDSLPPDAKMSLQPVVIIVSLDVLRARFPNFDARLTNYDTAMLEWDGVTWMAVLPAATDKPQTMRL